MFTLINQGYALLVVYIYINMYLFLHIRQCVNVGVVD